MSADASVSIVLQNDVAVLTLCAPPVNALSAAVRQGLLTALHEAAAEPSVRAIVIMGSGRGFSAGADIAELATADSAINLPALLDALESLHKPTVAAIHGMALGGGLELALSCHHRIATATAKLGLPEVKLGLLPGAGGTQRLPRLVGAEFALTMIVFGEAIDAQTALTHGLIDAVIDDELRTHAIHYARRLVNAGVAPLATRDRQPKLIAARADLALFERFQTTHRRRFNTGLEAPLHCVHAVKAAVELPFAQGMQLERQLFEQLKTSAQSRALRYAFFAERQATKAAALIDDIAPLPINKIGVIGAGTMGCGIAMNFLNVGLPVLMVETSSEALQRGQATIQRIYQSTLKKGRLTEADVAQRLQLLERSTDYQDLSDCDLIIEAVFEDLSVKQQVFAQLDRIAKAGAILATNTSYLNVNEIAAATARPGAVVGLHFFSPAQVMRLVEVVRAEHTQPAVLATAMHLAKRIGKVAVPVGVCHGFVGNRMLAARQAQAYKLILEGALPWDVDRVLQSFGLPMGPFAMADLAGLDLGWRRERSTRSTVREMLCEVGRFGQKTGAGFYDYDAERRATPSPVAERIILDLSTQQGMARRPIADQEVLERCLYSMINEGAKILQEGIAARASDIDVVWLNGYGWPAYRGGPMYYADSVGIDTVLARLHAYALQVGEEFKPAALLERLADSGGRLQDL